MMLLLPFLLAVAYGDRCAGANGILGIDTGYDYCCHAECPNCGGPDCWKKGNSDFYQGPKEGNKVGSNCCGNKINEYFGECSESVAAPCTLQKEQSAPQVQADKCDAYGGMLGVVAGDADACCPKACGQCGGDDCHRRRGAGANCCSGTVARDNDFCSDTNPAPCKIAKCAGVEMDNGECCASGAVDDCGVCDGSNECKMMSMRDLYNWCRVTPERCSDCRGVFNSANGSCIMKNNKLKKCKNYKDYDICEKLPGCKRVKKGNKTRCKGRASL